MLESSAEKNKIQKKEKKEKNKGKSLNADILRRESER